MRALDPVTVPLWGTQLVEASAGTGKTHTITTLFVRLLLERRLRVGQILVVTFTNAATAELRDRIRKRLRQALDAVEGATDPMDPALAALIEKIEDRQDARARLNDALGDVDEAAIFTIHGFCQRVLQNHAFETRARFAAELTADIRPLLTDLTQDFWTQRVHAAPESFVRHLRARQTNLRELVPLAQIAAAAPDLPLVAPGAAADPTGALDRYARARRKAAELWKAGRREVENLLLVRNDLNRSSYSVTSVNRWFSSMDALLAEDGPTLDGWFKEVEKFSPEALAKGTKAKCRTPAHPFFSAARDLWDAHAEAFRALDAAAVRFEHDLVKYVRAELPGIKEALGLQTFDDLLYELRAALRSPMGADLVARLRADHRVALIDEFHDTDPVQYEVFNRIFTGKDSLLLLIGDPKQAIYAFRGADVFAYLRAVADADSAWTLGTNYRSDPSLVHAMNTLFSRVERPFLFEDIAFRPVAAREGATDALSGPGGRVTPFEIVFVPRDASTGSKQPNADELPGLVAAEIAHLLHSERRLHGRRVEPGDIAVLTRTNKQAREIQSKLRELGVDSVLHGDSSVFESEEAVELACVMRAIADPGSPSVVKAALATTLLGLDANELFALHDDASWEGWISDFARWQRIWETRGFVQSMRHVMREKRVTPRMLRILGGERKLTNFLHLVELLHTEETTRRLRIPGLLQWFDEARHGTGNREGAVAPEAQQLRLESDARAVQLTTMHRSKGLEYPVVFCPYLWKGGGLWDKDRKRLRFHDPEQDGALTLDLRSEADKPDAIAIANREAFAESLRLCYVALTRAKHQLVVFWGAYREAANSPLGYLLHSPVNDVLGTAASSRVATLSDGALLADLGRLVEASGGAIAVRSASTSAAPIRERLERDPRKLASRVAHRRVGTAFRVSSFTALVSAASDDPQHGRDVDARAARAAPELRAAVAEETRVRLADFPRGAAPGEALHAVLEDMDFSERAGWKGLIEDALPKHGISAETWGAVVEDALDDVVTTSLDTRGLRLRDIDRRRRLSELEFTLAVGGRGPHDAEGLLVPKTLARAFAEHARDPRLRGYDRRLAALGFRPLAGFLRGFIDLVFEHDGLFYVVDYKSNHLGPGVGDYGQDALSDAMQGHHYVLQYHLYTVAVHRHLRSRLATYDYDAHFGGAFYLFLRGMSPERPAAGVFFERPDRSLITALDDLLLASERSPAS